MEKSVSISTSELRQYWEVPAIAHFCSLFRTIFNLLDFDIEELEEALSMDSTSRHSLIVDLLIALVKGCSGRRDVSLLNYNACLWDLLQSRWAAEIQDPEARNPLGRRRDAANFHALPLFPKIRLLHALCEFRLQRPDVDGLTRNLDGESLRVIALGKDDKGAAYWYFYGTRLYREEPEPLKMRLSVPKDTPVSKKKKRATPKSSRKAKGRKRKLEEEPEEEEEEVEEDEEEEEREPTPVPVKATPKGRGSRRSAAPTPVKKQTPLSRDSPLPARRSMRQAVARGFPAIDDIADSPAPIEDDDRDDKDEDYDEKKEEDEEDKEEEEYRPSPSKRSMASLAMRLKPQLVEASSNRSSREPSHTRSEEEEDEEKEAEEDASADNSRDASVIGNRTIQSMIDRMYSRDDDDEESRDAGPETPKRVISRENSQKKEELAPLPEENEEAEHLDVDESEGPAVEASSSSDTVLLAREDADSRSQSAGKATDTEDSAAKEEEEEKAAELPIEEEEEGPPAWEQPFMTPDPAQTGRWSIQCTSLEDWLALADGLGRSKMEKALHSLLRRDFLPEMESMFATKEKEHQARLAELNRRTSERVEIRALRKLQEDEEADKLAKREAVEMERIEAIEMVKRRKVEAEEREQRRKQREKERDKAAKLRERSKEDRAKRLEYRQQRQDMIAAGMEIPDELLHHGAGSDDMDAWDLEEELDVTYGQLEKVVDALKKHPDAEPFLSPVTDDVAPDYSEKIQTPMSVETIEDKLLERAYNNKKEFVADVNLIFLNCYVYNGRDSEYTKMAQQFERGFIRIWRKYFSPTAEAIVDNERAQKEAWACVGELGALDKKINEHLYIERERNRPPPRTPTATRASYSLGPGAGPSPADSSSRTTPFAEQRRGLPPPAPRVYGSNAQYRVLTPVRTTVGPSSGGVMRYAALPGRAPPLGAAPIRIARPPVVGQSSFVMRPPGARVASSFVPVRSAGSSGAPRQQIIRPGPPSGSGQKPSVYLLPSSDGENRLLKFVTKNGQPAPHELVQHLLPQLKREAHKLPRGLLTLTIDSQDDPTTTVASLPIPKEEEAGPSTSMAPVPTIPIASRPANPGTSAMPITATEVPRPVVNGDGTKSTKRFYNIGDNSYLAIEDSIPFLYKKQESGQLVKMQQVSRDGLLEKLKRIQASKAAAAEPKPVCSVAPLQTKPAYILPGPPDSDSLVVLAQTDAPTLDLQHAVQGPPAESCEKAPPAPEAKDEEEMDINEFLTLPSD